MANYDAQINIIVGGQRNLQNLTGQLNEIESTIEQIDRRWRAATAALQRARIRLNVAGTTQPRGEGGRFARDPDRQARFAAYADRRRASVESLLSRRAIARTRAEATATRDLIGQNERLISQTERRIALESRLNSANDLFQRRLQQLSRGGGGRNLTEELRAQVQSIQNAYSAAGGGASRNLRLVQSLATELGRVVERQNEFNRLRALGSKGFEAGRRLQERIDDIAGSTPSRRVRAARGLATEAIAASYRGDQQAYGEAIRRATAATARLERESRRLASTVSAQEREMSRIAKLAPRSPILGGSNFPGSPRAIQEQRRLQEEELRRSQKGFPSSPILGGPRMAGSPKWIATQERLAKAAANNAERALRESQAGYPASPIGGLASLAGSPKWIAAQKRAAVAAERALASQERAAKAAASNAERVLRESQKGYPASPIAGTASMMGSPKWIAAQQRAKSAAEKALLAQERSAKIAEKIANAEAEKALRESQKGYPSSPITGTATMAGSPKWIVAQEKAKSAAEKRAAAIRASEERIARAQKRAAIVAERAADKALTEAKKGYPSSPIMGGATVEGSPRWKMAQESAAKKLESAAIAAGRAADKALREAQKGFPSSPILGTATMIGSPKWNAAQERLARSGGSGMGGSIGQAFRAGGPGAALASISSPQRLASQQASATLLAEKLNNLEIKNVNTASERARLQQIINDLSQKDLQLSDELLNNFDIQLNSIRDYIRLQNQVVANDRAREAAAKKGGGGGAGGAGETGFAKSLKTFSESLEESRGYFGKQGPAQAIDQIVRAFRGDDPGSALKSQGSDVADNVSSTFASSIKKGAGRMTSAAKSVFNQVTQAINDAFGIASPSRFIIELVQNLASTYVSQLQKEYPRIKAATDKAFGGLTTERPVKQLTATGRGFEFVDRPSTGYRPLADRSFGPSGAGGEMDEMLRRFRDQIAQLTTQPEIYKNILNALPSSALTTDLAALASERARGVEMRGFMDVQRQLGPGELERYIQGQLAEVLKRIRIPNPWVGPIGDYKKFIEDVTATTKRLVPLLSGGKIPLALPPAASGQIKQYGPLATVTGRPRAAIPPAFDASSMVIDVIASVIQDAELRSDAEGKKLLDRIRNLFSGLFDSIHTTAQAVYASLRRGAAASEGQAGLSDFESAFDFSSPQAMQRARTRLGAQGGRFGIGTFSLFPSEGAIGPVGSGEKALDSLSSAVEEFVDRIRNSVSRITSFAGGGGGIPPSGGSAGAPGDPEDFARRVGQATTAEALLGLDELRNVRQLSSRELQLLSAAIEEVQQNLRPATADFDRFNNEVTQLRTRIGVEQGARSPDAGFLARRRIGPRTSRAISEGLVGGAFPLLFGQGLGASVGGGLGGALGGFAGGGLGFGLSLLGTGLGTAFDATIAAATELGGALNDLSSTFEVVKNRALFSSRETEKLAGKFEEAGLTATASILAQEEVIRKIGTSGVRDLKNLETASDRLSRAWAEFTLQLQVALAGPMAGLLDWVTQIVLTLGTFKNQDEFAREVGAGLSGRDKEEFDRRYAEIERLSRESILKGGLTPGQASDQKLLLARDFFTRSKTSGAIKTDADLALESQLTGAETFVNALNAKLSALDLGKSLIDQVKNATQEQEDLDRQRAKAVEDYERAIGDIRLGVERRITQERLNNLAKENEIYSKQGDIRLQQLKNENAIARESLRGNDLGQQLFDIVAQYSEEQLATENEIANRRRSLEAELQSVAIETEQYKVDVAKQVADLNRSTAEQVQQIQLSTARKQDQSARNRFELEKQIAIAQIKVQELSAKQEARKLETLIKAEKDTGVKADLQASLDIYKGFFEGGGANPFTALENQVKGLKPPAQLSYAGFNVGQGVSTAGYDAVIAKGNELRLRLEELAKALDSLVAAGKFVEVNTLFKNFADQGAAEAANRSKELKYQFDLLTKAAGAVDPRIKALADGQAKLLETTAGSKEEFKQLVPLYVQLAELNIKAADTYGFFNSAIDDNLNKANSLKEEINDLVAGATEYEKALASLVARGLSPASEEAQRLLASAQEIDRLQDKIEVINGIRDAATGLTESFRGLIDKFVEFKDAGKAVSEFSKEIGQRSFSFILDLAFKPVEENMQKQFIAIADQLGIDVKPEALKQLTELQKLNNQADSINKKIEPIVGSLAAIQKQAEAEALAKAKQQQALAGQAGAGITYGQTSGQQLGPMATRANVFTPTAAQAAWLKTTENQIRGQLQGIFSKESAASLIERYRSAISGSIRSQSGEAKLKLEYENAVNEMLNRVLERRIEQLSGMTGQGGPDLPDFILAQGIRGSGQAFPMDATTASPAPVQSVGPQPINVTPFDSTPAISPEGTKEAEKNLESFNQKINETTSGTKLASDKLNATKGQWLKGLGSVVTGLSTASSAVIGIVGGFQQIKQGGLANTLSGIGSILTTVGSIGMSVAGLSGFTGFGGSGSGNFSPDLVDAPLPDVKPGSLNIAAAGAMFTPNGPIEPFAKGAIVSSPTLFRFAKGGDSGDGLMGEDGAEAILPLGRTPSGDLGVKSIPYERQSGGSRLRVPYLRADAEYAGGGTDSPIRFESTVINSEEFVTRDEAEKIGRAAASRGAEIAQRRIKNNPQVRRSLGMV